MARISTFFCTQSLYFPLLLYSRILYGQKCILVGSNSICSLVECHQILYCRNHLLHMRNNEWTVVQLQSPHICFWDCHS